MTFNADFTLKSVFRTQDLGGIPNYDYAYTETINQSESEYFILLSTIMRNDPLIGNVYTDKYITNGSLFESAEFTDIQWLSSEIDYVYTVLYGV